MTNYDFLNLSPTEFEELTQSLLQKKMNVFFETFTEGKDGGIDLRYSSSRKHNIIVQCKRYKDFKSLMTNLKKEITKVKKIKPTRYLVVTSLGLTPMQKDEILKLFNPFIISTNDIIGRNELNSLLSIHKDIEKQHFKLWLSSINILEEILHSKVINESTFELEKIQETIKIYVNNDSFYKASEILNDKKYVIISGLPGIGKTTLARMLVFNYLGKGFEEFVYITDSINDAFTQFKEGKKQIFLYDDFLGRNFLESKLSNNEEKKIIHFIEKVSKSKNKIIILTTREYILAQAKQKYDVFNNPILEFSKCIIDLSHYTKLVRARILYNHLYFSNLPEDYISDITKNQNYKNIINHKTYNPRIIETITNDNIWKSIEHNNFYNKFLEFIEYPENIWKHVFENQISTFSQILLVNLMSAGTPILLEDLKQIVQNFSKINFSKYGITYNELEYKKAIKELEGTFIKITKDYSNNFWIDYQNPSVQDFLVIYFKELPDYITDIVKTTNYINQFLKVFSFYEHRTNRNKILLTKEQSTISINRIVNEFDNLNYAVNNNSHGAFPDYIKFNEINECIDLDNEGKLKNIILCNFKKSMFDATHQMSSSEMKCYINIVELFEDEFQSDVEKILYTVSESVIDLYEFEEFERFEYIFSENYIQILSNNDRHKKRIQTLMSLQIEHEEDDLEELLDEYITRSKKYKIDYTEIEERLSEKIAYKETQEDDDFDWNSERQIKRKEQEDKEDVLIKSIFDSLKLVKRDG